MYILLYKYRKLTTFLLRCIKEEDELKFLDEKYRSDITLKKKELTILDEKIMERDDKVQNCNAIIMKKDDWIEIDKINIENMKTQIIALLFNIKEQERAIAPLETKLIDLNVINNDVSIEYFN